jgi:hypothetical protein
MDPQRAVEQHQLIIKVLAAFIGNNPSGHIASTFQKLVSRECQQFLLFHLEKPKGY